MPEPDIEYLQAGQDGSVFYRDPNLGREVWLRVTEGKDGRWSVTDMHWPGARPIRTEDLRKVPIGKIEAFCNLPEIVEVLHSKMSANPKTLEQIARKSVVAVNVVNREIQQRRAVQRITKLRIPDERPYPSEFYAQVAAIYSDLSAAVRNPAIEFSEKANVPLSTVHRWIKEARARGELLPSRNRQTSE